MINIEKFVFNPFQVNTYVLYDNSGDCVVVDAACQTKEEFEELEDYLISNGMTLTALVNTHGHMDHLQGIKYFRDKYKVPFCLAEEDLFLAERAVEQAAMFGLRMEKPPMPDCFLKESEPIILGDSKITLLHAPGHSPGSMVLYMEQEKLAITGDVLFSLSIGRTDLPGGNYGQLINSIRTKLLVLDDDVRIFPGHGPASTIGDERKMNPFLN